MNCGEVARHPTSTGTKAFRGNLHSGYGTGTQRPGRSRSPVGSTILIVAARGVSSSPGRTHGAVEEAADYLTLLPGWRAPVRAENNKFTIFCESRSAPGHDPHGS